MIGMSGSPSSPPPPAETTERLRNIAMRLLLLQQVSVFHSRTPSVQVSLLESALRQLPFNVFALSNFKCCLTVPLRWPTGSATIGVVGLTTGKQSRFLRCLIRRADSRYGECSTPCPANGRFPGRPQ